MPAWPTLRDIGITGTGLVIVWSQLLLWVAAGRTPSDVLLAVGLGMLAPSATAHVKTVLGLPGSEPGHEAGASSSPSRPPSSPSSPPSSNPAEGTGD